MKKMIGRYHLKKNKTKIIEDSCGEEEQSYNSNNLNNKLVKIMFNRSIAETKNNKYESSGLKLLRDHINNRN